MDGKKRVMNWQDFRVAMYGYERNLFINIKLNLFLENYVNIYLMVLKTSIKH